MGSGCRSCAERQGTQPGAGVGRAVPEGSRSDTPQHARAFHPALEGAHRSRSWLWTVAGRSIVCCSREINAREEGSCRSERKISSKTTETATSATVIQKTQPEEYDRVTARDGPESTEGTGASSGAR